MSKARNLGNLVSTGEPLADGVIDTTDINGVTATATEINYLDGVTSSLQTQLDAKVNTTAIGSSVQAYDANLTSFLTAIDLPVADGAAGQVLTTDGAGNVAFADAGGGGTADFVASGAISNGDVVGLNNDGTVSVVQSAKSSQTTYESGRVGFQSAVFDSNSSKIVIAYQDADNLDYGTAVVGTVSGTSISFGTPVIFESSTTDLISATFDSLNNKVVIAYRNEPNSNRGTAIVGTVSGTSISFGSPVVFETGSTGAISATFDSFNNKVVIAYHDFTNNIYGTAVVGTVSGTSISFGTPVVFESSTVYETSATFDSSNNKVVISYQDGGNSQYGTAVVGTVSGTSISFGTSTVFDTVDPAYLTSVFDSNAGKVVVVYSDKAVVGTVSGTSISFGTPVVYEASQSVFTSATFDSSNNKVTIAYRDAGNSDFGTVTLGSVSGTSISFQEPYVFKASSTSAFAASHDPVADRTVIAYSDNTDNQYGKAVVVNPPAIETYLGWIGFAAEDISNSATGKITVLGGVNEGQTGLTPSSVYYLQDDATISTTIFTGREVGRALSATKLLVTERGLKA